MSSTPPTPGASRDVFSVSRLTAEVRAVLEGSFPLLWVEGEISNLARPRSGHLYFSLKDSFSQVRCAMFRNRSQLLRFQPGDGNQVVVRARVGFYEPRGDFQLIVEHMEPAGEGELLRAFEALKLKLETEGLFAPGRKRALPAFPRRIGVVTSPSGAAVHDILNVLRRRFPGLPVIVYPVPVQGAEAAEEIRQMLQLADRRGECDLLILARGGGSLEDLAPFNNETLARTIAGLDTPLISAVGHEVDFTIADFVADRRAPTPSAAAELASPDAGTLSTQVEKIRQQLIRAMRQRLQLARQTLDHGSAKLRLLHPRGQLRQRQQRLDELELRLQRGIAALLSAKQQRLAQQQLRLQPLSPQRRLADLEQKLQLTRRQLDRSMSRHHQRLGQRLALAAARLNTLSPLQTLGRGYSLTRNERGNIITAASQIEVGDHIETLLAQGRIRSVVKETEK